MRKKISLNYIGLIRSVASWARIGRELCLELQRICDLSITEQRGFMYERDFCLDPELQGCMEMKRNTEVDLAFIYPPLYKRLSADFCCAGMVYETTELPLAWVENINAFLDVLWVPNKFNLAVAHSSGVDIPCVCIPYGINPACFRKNETNKNWNGFRFLSISMPQKRKNLLSLIRAFYDAFPYERDVSLCIKVPYLGGRNEFEYREQDLTELIRDDRITLNLARIPDKELPDLYQSCDCYVQPSLSEGFGLTLLEAMACGVPVISTLFGGPEEFLDDHNSFIVSHTEMPAREIQYDNNSETAMIGKPLQESLVRCMKQAYSDSEGLQKKARAGMVTASSYTWERTAKELLRNLDRTRNA